MSALTDLSDLQAELITGGFLEVNNGAGISGVTPGSGGHGNGTGEHISNAAKNNNGFHNYVVNVIGPIFDFFDGSVKDHAQFDVNAG